MLRSLMAGVRALIRPSERNAQIEEELGSFFAASVEDSCNAMSAGRMPSARPGRR